MIANRSALVLVSLATACIAGCATTSSGREGWAYTGKDPLLRAPPTMRLGDSSDAAWRSEAADRMQAWQQLRKEATGGAKEACARETGESMTPDVWTGYSAPFMACMKARGWLCCFNDPL